LAATKRIEANGQEYILSGLDFADWQSLQKYIQYREYFELKEQCKEIPDLEAMLPDKLKECYGRKVDFNDVFKEVTHFDVLTELVYLSLRHFHKSIGKPETATILNPVNMLELLSIIFDLSGVPQDKPTTEGESKNA
jgi:hypothetical protein